MSISSTVTRCVLSFDLSIGEEKIRANLTQNIIDNSVVIDMEKENGDLVIDETTKAIIHNYLSQKYKIMYDDSDEDSTSQESMFPEWKEDIDDLRNFDSPI